MSDVLVTALVSVAALAIGVALWCPLARMIGEVDDPPVEPEPAGVALLTSVDLAAREHLSTSDDIVAARCAVDRMLVRRGLVTGAQLALIRHGTRSRAVVTAMAVTGAAREDYREVELDLMITRPAGGQFPAHEVALIPRSALDGVSAGSVIDVYYAAGDESSVAVCVPPG